MSTQYVIFQATAQTVPYFQSPRARGACFQSPAAILLNLRLSLYHLFVSDLFRTCFKNVKIPHIFICAGFYYMKFITLGTKSTYWFQQQTHSVWNLLKEFAVVNASKLISLICSAFTMILIVVSPSITKPTRRSSPWYKSSSNGSTFTPCSTGALSYS